MLLKNWQLTRRSSWQRQLLPMSLPAVINAVNSTRRSKPLVRAHQDWWRFTDVRRRSGGRWTRWFSETNERWTSSRRRPTTLMLSCASSSRRESQRRSCINRWSTVSLSVRFCIGGALISTAGLRGLSCCRTSLKGDVNF